MYCKYQITAMQKMHQLFLVLSTDFCVTIV